MAELFKAKVRRVGSSLGILIPKETADKENIKEGDEIEVSLLKRRNLAKLLKLAGTAKGATVPFERDREDRLEREGYL
jgi:antitoxin component of MazEF toxin-antitoxin module